MHYGIFVQMNHIGAKKIIMCKSSLHILIQEKFLLLNEAEWINTFPNCTPYVFL